MKSLPRLTIPIHRCVNIETLRRVSLSRQESELESFSPPSRQATIDSTWSMQTLTPALSESSSSTGSSSGSSSHPPNLTLPTDLVESEQLRFAVQEKDSKRIEQLIRQKTTEAEVSSNSHPFSRILVSLLEMYLQRGKRTATPLNSNDPTERNIESLRPLPSLLLSLQISRPVPPQFQS